MIPKIEDILHLLSQGNMSFDEAEKYVREHVRLAHGHRLSLRDHLAGQAMQGMLSRGDSLRFTHTELAERAYALADAMLEARKV
tara:strand:+ start:179 stop:430 length:252 start_codon:yes stop_codon:yes gene_type:complete